MIIRSSRNPQVSQILCFNISDGNSVPLYVGDT
jgi:hypothetical protein